MIFSRLFVFSSALLCVICGLLLRSVAAILPEDRTYTWSQHTGVPGGIIHRTEQWTNVVQMGADPTGVADSTPAFNAALSSAPSNSFVMVPAGDYRIDTYIDFRRRGVTLRGAGPSLTRLIDYSTVSRLGVIQMGQNDPVRTNRSILSGATRGSSVVSVDNLADIIPIATNQLVYISQDDPPIVQRYNGLVSQHRMWAVHLIAGLSGGTNIHIYPPLFASFTNTPVLRHIPNVYHYSGVEDLTITHRQPGGGHGLSNSLYWDQMFGCWIRNVHSTYTPHRHFYINNSASCTLQSLHAQESSTGSYGPNVGPGIEFFARQCFTLVEDISAYKCWPSIMISYGSSGNVFSGIYSYGTDTGAGIAGGDLNCNHGGHNVFNLFENSIAHTFQSDGYHGTASHTTGFRLWTTSQHPIYTDNWKGWSLERGSLFFSRVGCLTGTKCWPGILTTTDAGYSITLKLIDRLGFPHMGSTTHDGTTNPPSSSTSAFDARVLTTFFDHKSWNTLTELESITQGYDPAIPASLYYAGRPSWCPTNIHWPFVGRDVPGYAVKFPAVTRLESILGTNTFFPIGPCVPFVRLRITPNP